MIKIVPEAELDYEEGKEFEEFRCMSDRIA